MCKLPQDASLNKRLMLRSAQAASNAFKILPPSSPLLCEDVLTIITEYFLSDVLAAFLHEFACNRKHDTRSAYVKRSNIAREAIINLITALSSTLEMILRWLNLALDRSCAKRKAYMTWCDRIIRDGRLGYFARTKIIRYLYPGRMLQRELDYAEEECLWQLKRHVLCYAKMRK